VAAAVDAADAHAGPDTVAIGAGTHNLGNGVTVMSATTEVRGAGVGSTILTADPPTPAWSSKTVIAGYMSRLSDLTVRLPSADTGALNSIVYGVDVYDGDVEHVRIDAEGATFGSGLNDGSGEAMTIRGGTVRDLDIDLDLDSDTRGMRVIGPVDLEDVDITSPAALSSDPEAQPNPVTVTARRVWLRSDRPVMVGDGHLELSDAVLDARAMAPGAENAAAWAVDGRFDPTSLTLDRVTMIGNGEPDSAALGVDGQGAVPATAIRARHLVVTGFGHTLRHANYGGDAAATIDYSNVDTTSPGAIVHVGADGGFTGSFGPGNVAGNPQLLAPATGDYRLTIGSPAIDIGGDDLLAGGPTDLGGDPRPTDGDGNGSALNDAGAFEGAHEPLSFPPADPDPGPDPDPDPRPSADRSVSVVIDGGKLRLDPSGATQATVRCPDSEVSPPCTGTLGLETKRKLKRGKRVKLAAATFSIGAGQAAAVNLTLSPRKAAMVRGVKKARKVIATADVSDAAGNTATVTQRLKLKPIS
jgi:hypothetical protein